MFEITDAAVVQMKTLLEQYPDTTAFRVGIKGGGCSGFSYVFELETGEPSKKDLVIEKDGITVHMDKKSSLFLLDTTLDYQSSFMKSGFTFLNEQAKSTCGCGMSFSPQ